jgi:hypothetical protein
LDTAVADIARIEQIESAKGMKKLEEVLLELKYQEL